MTSTVVTSKTPLAPGRAATGRILGFWKFWAFAADRSPGRAGNWAVAAGFYWAGPGRAGFKS